jgi:phospholipase/carboxylesterase
MRIDGPRLPPARGGAPAKLVIFAHGYGSNGADLIGLGQYWRSLLPDAQFVSPNAPEPVPGFPGGFQWFPITRMDPAAMAAGARRAAATLDRFIDGELQRYRLPASACALVGFSQGTMMALHVGLRRAEPLAAIVGYSGALVAPETLAGEVRSRPPVLLAHGDADDMVPVDALFAALDGLAAADVPARFHISPRLGHSIDEDGLALGGAFLTDAFAGRLSGWAAPEPRTGAPS